MSYVLDQSTGVVGAGLYNSGNTCYIASVLQCLTHTLPLVERIRSHNHKIHCHCENETFCVTQALYNHIQVALKFSGQKLKIGGIAENIEHFSPDFLIGNQEDAYDFLQSFLEKLEAFSKEEFKNIVGHVFGGVLSSRIRCSSCNAYSDRLEASLGLSVETEGKNSLREALQSFTSFEKLEEELTCDNCSEDCDDKVSKVKRLLLHKLLIVAIFHLKTFSTNMEKIMKHIEFPVDLDLLPYLTKNQNPEVSTKYKLYAMVEHQGPAIFSGHYIAYVRSGDIWYRFDDAEVTKVAQDHVLNRNAYILFYAREGTATVLNLRKLELVDAKKQKENEEAKELLVNMIVNDTLIKTGYMEQLRETKLDVCKKAWDEKRKVDKEIFKKKREEVKKKREEKQQKKKTCG